MDDSRYTLREAKRILREQECEIHGHDWEIVTRWGGDPTNLSCGRCGSSWTVLPKEAKD